MSQTAIPFKLVLDVDETLIDSTERHHRFLEQTGKLLGWEDMPNYEQFLELGGSHGAFGKYPGYLELNAHMCSAEWFNKDLVPIQAAQKAVSSLEEFVAFYLTTRPESISRLTAEELQRNGFPQREVICRPPKIPVEDTSQWKLSVLQKKARELNQRLIMIDDSVSMHHAIIDANDPLVGTLLYAGLRTPRGNGAVDWDQVLEDFADKTKAFLALRCEVL